MGINDFVEMNIFLCIICFSIYADKYIQNARFHKWMCFCCFFFVCVLHRNSSRKIASFVFYVEIQVEKSPVDSADNLGVKNFAKIARSPTISEINTFLQFTQKLAGNWFVRKVASRLWGSKFLSKSLYLSQFLRY